MAIELMIVECLEFDGEMSDWKEVRERFFDCVKRKGCKHTPMESQEKFEKFYCGEKGRKAYKQKCMMKTKMTKLVNRRVNVKRQKLRLMRNHIQILNILNLKQLDFRRREH